MGLESPVSILYNSEGNEIAVSQSMVLTGSTPGLMLAASTSSGLGVLLRAAPTGELFVTGTLALATPATQSVYVGGWVPTVTASVNVVTWSIGVTASVRDIGASTTLVSAVLATTTSFALFATNVDRRSMILFKEGGGDCFVKFGATASSASYTVKLGNNGFFDYDKYTGRVDIIFSTQAPASILRVTEVSYP
jgi:hypothetical protein